MSELKPCPFCGGEADYQVVDRWPKAPSTYHDVGCFNPTCIVQPKARSTDKGKAIYGWNTRPGEADAFPSFEEWKKKAIPDPVALSWVEMGLIEEAWAAAAVETKRRAVETCEAWWGDLMQRKDNDFDALIKAIEEME